MNNFMKKMLSYSEFVQDIQDYLSSDITPYRKGQAVFNYIDEKYQVARLVQYVDKVDCFFNDALIPEFINKAYLWYEASSRSRKDL